MWSGIERSQHVSEQHSQSQQLDHQSTSLLNDPIKTSHHVSASCIRPTNSFCKVQDAPPAATLTTPATACKLFRNSPTHEQEPSMFSTDSECPGVSAKKASISGMGTAAKEALGYGVGTVVHEAKPSALSQKRPREDEHNGLEVRQEEGLSAAGLFPSPVAGLHPSSFSPNLYDSVQHDGQVLVDDAAVSAPHGHVNKKPKTTESLDLEPNHGILTVGTNDYEESPAASHESSKAIGENENFGTNSLQSKKVNNEQWDAMFARLVKYKEKHGDCLVPKRYVEDPKLGTWVETQRVQYKRLPRTTCLQSGAVSIQTNKRLNEERLNKLESIGFAWSAKNVRKPRLASSSTAVGAASSALAASDPALPVGGKSKRASLLSSKNEEQPGSLAASIASSRAAARQRVNDAQWEEMYQRLKEYKARHGDCLVPRRYEQDPKLATWVETQRVLWNRDYRNSNSARPSSPTPSHASSIDQGTQYAVDAEDQFRRRETETEPEVGLQPPNQVSQLDIAALSTEHDPTSMGHGEVTGGRLSDYSTSISNAMHRNSFQNAAHSCGEQPPQFFNGPIEQVESDNGLLDGQPRSAQLLQTQLKRLTPERKKKLDELGFVWSLRSKRIEDHWDQMFRQLQDYKTKHGDCLVPSRYEENLKLGKWVETQRYEYTKLQRAAENADGKVEGMEKTSSGEISGSNKVAAPRPTNPRLTEDRLRRLEEIGFEWKVKHKMKRYYDKQWDHMFEQLLDFKTSTGHCMVPKRYPPNMKLGTWVHTQRIQYRKLMSGAKKGAEDGDPGLSAPTEEELKEMTTSMKGEEEVSYRLTEARRKRLEDIGFVWSAREGEKGNETVGITRNSYDDQWDVMFEKLKEYKAKHGDCLVPKRCKENPKLGTWVDTQRVQFKKLKKKLASQGRNYEGPSINNEYREDDETALSSLPLKPLVGRLTDDRIRRLRDLGFVWSLRDDWQKHYDELKEYKRVHGHCNVPARYSENRRLGIWVSAQRQQYKIMNQEMDQPRARRSAPLTQERIDLLNEIGFTWTIRSRDSLGESWNQRLQELRDFKLKFGHTLVPSRYPPNPELGIWVGTQRTQYRLYMKAKETGQTLTGSTAINEARINELEELGFAWALRGSDGKKDADETLSVYSNDVRSDVGADDTALSVASASTDCTDGLKIQTGVSATSSASRGEYGVATAATHADADSGDTQSSSVFRDSGRLSSLQHSSYMKLVEGADETVEIKEQPVQEIQVDELEL